MMGGITLNYFGFFAFYGLLIAGLALFHKFFGRFAGDFLKKRLMAL